LKSIEREREGSFVVVRTCLSGTASDRTQLTQSLSLFSWSTAHGKGHRSPVVNLSRRVDLFAQLEPFDLRPFALQKAPSTVRAFGERPTFATWLFTDLTQNVTPLSPLILTLQCPPHPKDRRHPKPSLPLAKCSLLINPIFHIHQKVIVCPCESAGQLYN
jgi:hypothetical protein